jgi:hypothetical protein
MISKSIPSRHFYARGKYQSLEPSLWDGLVLFFALPLVKLELQLTIFPIFYSCQFQRYFSQQLGNSTFGPYINFANGVNNYLQISDSDWLDGMSGFSMVLGFK